MTDNESSLLFNFSVKLTSAGHISVEHSNIKPEEFKEVMDKWNKQYENTEIFVSLLEYLSTHSSKIERDIYKILH
jgi:hypothetical protein|tara:strand:+ start:1162 stop:1386 length:225 start_codon:yes stop_codon:yes gene_type:complete